MILAARQASSARVRARCSASQIGMDVAQGLGHIGQMWIERAYRDFGEIDVKDLTLRVREAPEEHWLDGEYLRQQLTLARQTNSIFLRSMPTQTFEDILSERPIAPDDIETVDSGARLADVADPALQEILHRVAPGGLILRAQLARMNPGAVIKPHVDSSALLTACHRVHVALTTNDLVEFKINGQPLKMPPGKIFELNNRVRHTVSNAGATSRIHLIVDILPQAHNTLKALKRGFELARKQRVADKHQPPAPVRQNLSLPTVIATSVVRGAEKNDSHGGIYLVNLQSGAHKQVVDWNTVDISWEGRGWDRGLRGIAFHGDKIYVAASDELFCFNQDFSIAASWRSPYLRHAHEMSRHQDHLYVTSTGYDSILRFDLTHQTFDKAWLIRPTKDGKIGVASYDPAQQGPEPENRLHINAVHCDATGFYVGARALPFLLHVGAQGSRPIARIPTGTHNAMPYRGGVIYNHTNEDVIAIEENGQPIYLPVPTYPETALENSDLGDEKLARQGFGRGLCWTEDGILLSGSSPSTITAWDLPSRSILTSVNLSMDVRNAIHGLQIWPFEPV